jgi:hypothetical protein
VGLFRKKTLNDLIPIHPDNIGNKDWVILLEAGTIVGPSPRRIRVARWMQEKKILKKYDMFLRTKYFIVIEGYNPRIHALYLCPQLFRHYSDKLVPLEGEEIGELIARSVEAGAPERCPWYDPMEATATGAIIRQRHGNMSEKGVFASRRAAVVRPAWPVGRSLLIQERDSK